MFMSVWCPEDSKAIKIKIEGCHFCQEIDGCHFVRKTSHFRGKNRVPREGVDWSPGTLILFRGARSPIVSLLGALTVFYGRPWGPQDVYCRGLSPKY